MRTAAILPVKRFAAAKSRLGETVAEQLRARLARAMVTDDLAAGHGAVVIEDTAERGQSAAVALGVRQALTEGFERVLCVPGDCPALDPAELDRLLAGPAEPVVIVP